MLNDLQLSTADRLLEGIDQIADAVHRLNELAKTLRVPPIGIRFQPSKLIHGENDFAIVVNRLISEEYKRRLLERIGQEHARRADAAKDAQEHVPDAVMHKRRQRDVVAA